MIRAVLTLAGAVFAGLVAAQVSFSDTEKEAIARHGPWPPALQRDAGNRHSGQPAVIAFGRQLFFDPRLSLEGSHACASCHLPQQAWTDGRQRSI